MKKIILGMLITLSFMLSIQGPSLGSQLSKITISNISIAQEAPSSNEADSAEVKSDSVEIERASDMEHHKLEMPEWLGSVVSFLKSAPVVGPYMEKVLSFMGVVVSILTALSALLMMLSGLLLSLGKKKNSPSWLKKAKKYVDYAKDAAMALSVFNKQKNKK